MSWSEGIEGNVFVVTGGVGLVGASLCLELEARGAKEVRAFDLRQSSPWSDELSRRGVPIIHGDITCKNEVGRALRGADCVFHVASYGMSGKEMLQEERVEKVNVEGTRHVLEACIRFGITRLVYVSTYNVVFGGQEIVNGDESLPYFPNHIDPYSRTKAIAEKLVLESDGRVTMEGRRLRTCAIRPAAIYGPGEERHLPRMTSLAKIGLLRFRIGRANVKTDWVYVDNLVSALILASKNLRQEGAAAAGQAYFISDGVPVNLYDFLRPLFRSMGHDLPSPCVDVTYALAVSRIVAGAYNLLLPWLSHSWIPQPLLLPAEVYKVGVTNYCSISKARKELGYSPLVTAEAGLASTISYWRCHHTHQPRRSFSRSYPIVLFFLLLMPTAFFRDINAIPLLEAFTIIFALAALLPLSYSLYSSSLLHKTGNRFFKMLKRAHAVNKK